MLPNTPDRVPSHTSTAVNRRIQHDTAESVRWHGFGFRGPLNLPVLLQ